MIENTINRAINLINGAIRVIKLIPGVSINEISRLSLPRLAKGNVATEPTVAMFGEYAGASSNPEITAPQSTIYDTVRRALEDTNFNNDNTDKPINLAVYVGNKKLGEIVLDEFRDKTRRTGKDIEAVIGG